MRRDWGGYEEGLRRRWGGIEEEMRARGGGEGEERMRWEVGEEVRRRKPEIWSLVFGESKTLCDGIKIFRSLSVRGVEVRSSRVTMVVTTTVRLKLFIVMKTTNWWWGPIAGSDDEMGRIRIKIVQVVKLGSVASYWTMCKVYIMCIVQVCTLHCADCTICKLCTFRGPNVCSQRVVSFERELLVAVEESVFSCVLLVFVVFRPRTEPPYFIQSASQPGSQDCKEAH